MVKLNEIGLDRLITIYLPSGPFRAADMMAAAIIRAHATMSGCTVNVTRQINPALHAVTVGPDNHPWSGVVKSVTAIWERYARDLVNYAAFSPVLAHAHEPTELERVIICNTAMATVADRLITPCEPLDDMQPRPALLQAVEPLSVATMIEQYNPPAIMPTTFEQEQESFEEAFDFVWSLLVTTIIHAISEASLRTLTPVADPAPATALVPAVCLT